MKSAPVQNSSSLASHSCAVSRLFNIVAVFFLLPCFLNAQADTSKLAVAEKQSIQTNDTTIKPASPAKTKAPYYYLTPKQKSSRQWLVGGINVIGYGASL